VKEKKTLTLLFYPISYFDKGEGVVSEIPLCFDNLKIRCIVIRISFSPVASTLIFTHY
jgi:hypothetical protein